jgi:hypothetical protein
MSALTFNVVYDDSRARRVIGRIAPQRLFVVDAVVEHEGDSGQCAARDGVG